MCNEIYQRIPWTKALHGTRLTTEGFNLIVLNSTALLDHAV